jgi:YggT family protein
LYYLKSPPRCTIISGATPPKSEGFPVFLISNLLSAIAQVLSVALTLYMWIIIIRALLSWVNPDPYNPIVQFLYSITEPLLYRVRRYLPMSNMGLDFAPIVIILAIMFLQTFLVQSLGDIAMQLR